MKINRYEYTKINRCMESCSNGKTTEALPFRASLCPLAWQAATNRSLRDDFTLHRISCPQDPGLLGALMAMTTEAAKARAVCPDVKTKSGTRKHDLQVRILVTASSLKGHAGKKQSIGANSIRAFLLERCLEVQAQRCWWSDDARPLHSPASHAEPVGIPP